jgi:SET domain-containing protein
MFIVRNSLRPSPIQGLGCFAEEPVKKGQIIWQYDPRFDIRIPVTDLSSFPPAVQEHLQIYTYVEMVDGQEVMVYCADLSKHMNHSDNPNLLDTPDNLQQIAARDIEPGEEFTCNYFTFDLDAFKKLSGRQINPSTRSQ